MRKDLLTLSLVGAAGLAAPSASLAQPPGKQVPTTAELKKNLALVAASTEEESEAVNQLMGKTAKQLLAYLKTHELSAAATKDLGLEYVAARADDPTHLTVYTYSYSSGGTRGTIHRPVFQWRNAAGRLFAYAAAEECGFYEIHRLASPGRTQYLLLGNEKADGRCDISEAFVVELKGDYLLLDNAAFGPKPSLALCNVDMTFDRGRQVLHLDMSGDNGVPEYNDEDLAQVGFRQQPGVKTLDLQFSQGRFVKKAAGARR
jgi:hypothetical protein